MSNEKTVEEFFDQPHVRHTLKLVPHTQRELFVLEMSRALADFEAQIVKREQADRYSHKGLHNSLGHLLAAFIDVTGRMPSKTTVRDLLNWSYRRVEGESEEITS
jgi:hypothetical protein